MNTLRDLDISQANAIDTRIELDLRIGAAYTRFQTVRLQNRFEELKSQVISYGTIKS